MEIAAGNVDGNKRLTFACRQLFGQFHADRGYIAQWLVERSQASPVGCNTSVRKNRKQVPSAPFAQALSQRRALVETVFNELKNLCLAERRVRVRVCAASGSRRVACQFDGWHHHLIDTRYRVSHACG